MRHYILLLLVALLSWGCSDMSAEVTSEDVTEGVEVQIYSDITSSTRVTDDEWDTGDQIGIFMTYNNTSYIISDRSNVSYTTTSGNGIFTPTSEPIYYPHNTATVDFYAYSPYTSDTLLDNPSNILIDLSSQSDLPSLDLMRASVVDVANEDRENEIVFQFERVLSKITIRVNPGDGFNITSLLGMSVKLSEQTKYANYEILSGELSDDVSDYEVTYSSTTITLDKSRDGDTYVASAIIMPQTFSDDCTVTFILSDSEVFTLSLSDVDFNNGGVGAGENLYYNVTLNRRGLEVDSSNIISWNESEYTYTGSSVSYDYTIYNVSDLVGLDSELDGITPLNVILMNDITITDSVWSPIGNSSKPFIGTFDGNGKSISGLTINDASSSYRGLFEVVGDGINDTEIKRLTINEPEIIGGDHVGGIAGISYNCTFTDCAVIGGVISGANYTGGLVGTASSTQFFNCTNSSTAEDSTVINPIAGALLNNSQIID